MSLALTTQNLFIAEIDYDDVPWINKIFLINQMLKMDIFYPITNLVGVAI